MGIGREILVQSNRQQTMMKVQNNANLRTLVSVLVLLTSLPATLQAVPQPKAGEAGSVPKLIVGITIDQLRSDYLTALRDKLGENGFKRLLNGGRVYSQVTFDLDNPDATATLAVLATGAYPCFNGIPARQVWDSRLERPQSVFWDRDFSGKYTAETLSPKALSSTVLADELKVASGGASRVFSIAPDAETAILNGGHTSNCAVWIDNRTGKWASTGYYREFPSFVAEQNVYSQSLFADLTQTVWEPLEGTAGQPNRLLPYRYKTSRFAHSFYQDNRISYPAFKTSPMVNDAIMGLTRRFFRDGFLGKNDSFTDMLQLSFYAGTYLNERPELYADELQDIYLRLDKTIANLLALIDQEVGLDNTFIYIVSNGQTLARTTDAEGTLRGEFNTVRCQALLNAHLVSRYGQEQWVGTVRNGQIYLNRDAIRSHRLSRSEVETEAAGFLTLMDGIDDVVTASRLLSGDSSDRLARLRNGYHKATGGDLVFSLQPGWVMQEDDSSASHSQTRHDITPGLALLFAPGITASTVTVPVDAACIAPTIAACIRIRAPSACRVPALTM